MAVRKPHVEVLGPISVEGGATTALSDCIMTDCTTATQLVVTFRGTFHGSATGAARITLWPSYSGEEGTFDTSPWENWLGVVQAWDVRCEPEVSVVRTSEGIGPLPKYLKFKVENLDATYTITNVSLIVTTQKAGG